MDLLDETSKEVLEKSLEEPLDEYLRLVQEESLKEPLQKILAEISAWRNPISTEEIPGRENLGGIPERIPEGTTRKKTLQESLRLLNESFMKPLKESRKITQEILKERLEEFLAERNIWKSSGRNLEETFNEIQDEFLEESIKNPKESLVKLLEGTPEGTPV